MMLQGQGQEGKIRVLQSCMWHWTQVRARSHFSRASSCHPVCSYHPISRSSYIAVFCCWMYLTVSGAIHLFTCLFLPSLFITMCLRKRGHSHFCILGSLGSSTHPNLYLEFSENELDEFPIHKCSALDHTNTCQTANPLLSPTQLVSYRALPWQSHSSHITSSSYTAAYQPIPVPHLWHD